MAKASEEYSFMTRMHFLAQSIFQFLLAVFVTSTVWLMSYHYEWKSYNTWHVFLTTVGFAFFMAEAVSLLGEGNGFLVGVGKNTRNLLHGFFMVLATGSVVAGISLKIQDKTNGGRQHFTSVHGKLGLAALILTLIAFLGGIVTYFATAFYKRIGIKPVWIRVLHTLVGCSAYLIGSIALGYGVHDYFGIATVDTRKALTVIMGIYVVLGIVIGPVISLAKVLLGGMMKY